MRSGDSRPLPARRTAVEPVVFVPAEVGGIEEPGTKELILRGRAAFADLGYDPDDWVDAETEAQARRARSFSTGQLRLWAFGGLVTYTGALGLRHDPPTPATIRRWIKDHWEMTRVTADGKRVKRGRLEQPYAPGTVETRVYLIAGICNKLGWQNPVKDPRVDEQLTAYRIQFEDARFRTFEADPMTPSLSVRLAREACDLATVNGLRNALAFRMQFDTGCRAAEMVGEFRTPEEKRVYGEGATGLSMEDVAWLDDDRVELNFIQTKGRKPRKVYMQAVRDIDWDVDPVRLLGLWMDALRSAGITSGPLFREVSHAGVGRRRDWETSGIYSGKILHQRWDRHSYQMCWDRAVRKTGIDIGPKNTKFRFTTHSNRAGLITAAADAGMPLEKVAHRTGHSPSSPVIVQYFRSDRRWGDDNPGVLIRRAKADEDARLAAERKGKRGKK